MVYDFEQQLSKIEQGCMDVSTYYTQIMTLWEEHKNYVELHVCIRGAVNVMQLRCGRNYNRGV